MCILYFFSRGLPSLSSPRGFPSWEWNICCLGFLFNWQLSTQRCWVNIFHANPFPHQRTFIIPKSLVVRYFNVVPKNVSNIMHVRAWLFYFFLLFKANPAGTPPQLKWRLMFCVTFFFCGKQHCDLQADFNDCALHKTGISKEGQTCNYIIRLSDSRNEIKTLICNVSHFHFIVYSRCR